MKSAGLIATLTVCSLPLPSAFAIDNDALLQKIIVANDLRPLATKPFEVTSKYRLGQALFFDPILSGNRDTSCATCHVFEHGTSDGLAMSIGPGGASNGSESASVDGSNLHPRNSLDLWNRDNRTVTAMFWDGRVELLDPKLRRYRSPMDDALPHGVQNLLAVQALFPLVTRDEMLGGNHDPRPGSSKSGSNNLVNELVLNSEGLSGHLRIQAVHKSIMIRLIGSEGSARSELQEAYIELFIEAYPDVKRRFTIVDAVNAIAHFEEFAFLTRETPWDKYLAGDNKAISDDEKAGGVIFFGKGRCSICHSGPLFSDFRYHAIGVRQTGSGVNVGGSDYGRYNVTDNPDDMYKFRTPPLRNVTLTAPYFHDGGAATLHEAIAQHLDPYRFVTNVIALRGQMM